MDKQKAESRILALKEAIEKYRYEYHVLDQSSISEEALDSLKHELYQLEQEYPEFITSDSPTQRVGGRPLEKFEKWTHQLPMLSMEDVFTEQEFIDWHTRIEKFANESIDDFLVMPKIDGLAASLTYRDGVLVSAATRGDGKIGEDVTQNVKTIESVPLSLTGVLAQGEVLVRGEIYITKEDFEGLNKERATEGLEAFANPRNLAAGSIRQLDPAIAASRKLRFFAWTVEMTDIPTQSDIFTTLQGAGFVLPDYKMTSLKGVGSVYQELQKKRDDYSYWLDGVVVRVNDRSLFERLGVVGKTPRGLVAWKFPAEEKTTIIRSVDWSVGRTGKLTPVATVDPTFIAGTTVTHATLHNPDEIKRLDVRLGDTVILIKAGDIIPKIKQVLPELRDGSEQDIEIPQECPVCASLLTAGEVDLFCKNPNCFSIESERISYGVKVLGIDGMGPKAVEKFLQAGLLSTVADLYRLQKDEIAQLEGYGEKSAEKLVEEIQSKKEIEFATFIQVLSIPHIGEETSRILARHLMSRESLLAASLDSLEHIEGIGPIVAKELHDSLRSERVRHLLEELDAVGVVVSRMEAQGHALEGKSFVLTGTLPVLSRDEAKQMIRRAGGNVSSSVSSKTDFLLAGDKAGSKLKKAEELGVRVISEEEFKEMI
jgi:DNA ligase (NAD+)